MNMDQKHCLVIRKVLIPSEIAGIGMVIIWLYPFGGFQVFIANKHYCKIGPLSLTVFAQDNAKQLAPFSIFCSRICKDLRKLVCFGI